MDNTDKKILEDTLAVEPEGTIIEKTELPADIVTGQVSDMWAQIGNLKAMNKSLSHDFLKSGRVVAILQDLLDAYLVAVGQLELHLHDNNFLGDSENDSEDIADAARLTVEKGEEGQEESAKEESPEDEKFPDAKFEVKPEIKGEPEVSGWRFDKISTENKPTVKVEPSNEFDFDFPAPSSEKLTDKDLYSEAD